eukprot:4461160-Prymnesium_polylepis.1
MRLYQGAREARALREGTTAGAVLSDSTAGQGRARSCCACIRGAGVEVGTSWQRFEVARRAVARRWPVATHTLRSGRASGQVAARLSWAGVGQATLVGVVLVGAGICARVTLATVGGGVKGKEPSRGKPAIRPVEAGLAAKARSATIGDGE